MGHAPEGGAGKFLGEARAGAGGGFIAGGKLGAQMVEEALSHG